MTKFMKRKQVTKDRSFVNFAHTNEFSGLAVESGFFGRKYGYWIVDTGASIHVCSNLNMFKKLTTLSTSTIVHLLDGGMKKVLQMGDVNFYGLNLKETLLFPTFKYYLLSVCKLSKTNSICYLFFYNIGLLQALKSRRLLAIWESNRRLIHCWSSFFFH